jgi:hypothetical protein
LCIRATIGTWAGIVKTPHTLGLKVLPDVLVQVDELIE